MKSLLFPTPKKLLLAVFLFFAFGWFVWPAIIESQITDWFPSGFPLAIHAVGLCIDDCIRFSWLALIVDVSLWYFASAILIRAKVSFWQFCAYFVLGILGLWLITLLLLSFDIVPF